MRPFPEQVIVAELDCMLQFLKKLKRYTEIVLETVHYVYISIKVYLQSSSLSLSDTNDTSVKNSRDSLRSKYQLKHSEKNELKLSKPEFQIFLQNGLPEQAELAE